MFTIQSTKYFDKKFKKLTKNNQKLKDKIIVTIIQLSDNPFDQSIRTHKVEDNWSSSVTGDIRILWIFEDDEIKVIQLINIGGHSGGNSVY